MEILEQFVVEINGKMKTFTSRADAQAAVDAEAGSAEALATAQAFVASRGYEGKKAKQTINVVVDFLQFVDAGCPEPVEAPATVVEDTVEEVVETPAPKVEVADEAVEEAVVATKPTPKPKPAPKVVELDEGDDDDWMSA